MKSIYLSKKDVARKLNVSPSTVVRWSKSNIIPMPFPLGYNKIVWDETEINQAIDKRKKEEGFLDISQRNNQCQQNSMKIN